MGLREEAVGVTFNSRPHEEVDANRPPEGGYAYLSTHDLTKRSTICSKFLDIIIAPFNSRPHEEVDIVPCSREFLHYTFNSRPHEEVDV